MEELVSLVIKVRRGDLQHLRANHPQSGHGLGYSYSLLDDFDLAEDAAQESFIEAYLHICELREPAFAGWFRQIVFRQCTRMLRDRKLHGALDSAADVPSSEPGPDTAYERREMREEVLAAIRSLPKNERVVTTLFYINGYSHNDIAGFLEYGFSTVKSRLHTSRGRLKERMIEWLATACTKMLCPRSSRAGLYGISRLLPGSEKECTFRERWRLHYRSRIARSTTPP